jgi:8-oxo-dGTP pyrophosphatase MutT (NUDIX family)
MERELYEETGIRPDEIRNTTVVGFARWLERGAKPEFFGLTQLTVTADDLAGRRPAASRERLYSEGTFTLPADIGALGHEVAGGVDPLNAPSLSRRIREVGSLPLLLALRAAGRWRARNAAADHVLE